MAAEEKMYFWRIKAKSKKKKKKNVMIFAWQHVQDLKGNTKRAADVSCLF